VTDVRSSSPSIGLMKHLDHRQISMFSTLHDCSVDFVAELFSATLADACEEVGVPTVPAAGMAGRVGSCGLIMTG